jgi:hypothetical protein
LNLDELFLIFGLVDNTAQTYERCVNRVQFVKSCLLTNGANCCSAFEGSGLDCLGQDDSISQTIMGDMMPQAEQLHNSCPSFAYTDCAAAIHRSLLCMDHFGYNALALTDMGNARTCVCAIHQPARRRFSLGVVQVFEIVRERTIALTRGHVLSLIPSHPTRYMCSYTENCYRILSVNNEVCHQHNVDGIIDETLAGMNLTATEAATRKLALLTLHTLITSNNNNNNNNQCNPQPLPGLFNYKGVVVTPNCPTYFYMTTASGMMCSTPPYARIQGQDFYLVTNDMRSHGFVPSREMACGMYNPGSGSTSTSSTGSGARRM